MTTLTLELTDEQAQKWAQEAERLHITLEQLAVQSVEQCLAVKKDSAEMEFESAAEYVFQKNSELYARLADRKEQVSYAIRCILNENEELYRRLASSSR